MFDLLPFKRKSAVPNVFSEMDDMLKKMWYGFPFPKSKEAKKKVAQIEIK